MGGAGGKGRKREDWIGEDMREEERRREERGGEGGRGVD